MSVDPWVSIEGWESKSSEPVGGPLLPWPLEAPMSKSLS